MWFKRLIPEGGLIPKGYGVVWRANEDMDVVCCPLPFNLIIRACLDFYYWIIHGCWKSRWERELLNIRLQESKRFREEYKERLMVLGYYEHEYKKEEEKINA